jgi:hypothetical protein
MIKKNNTILFSTFLGILFTYLPVNKAFAALEVSYPAIKTLSGADTAPVTDLPSYIKYIFDAGMAIGMVAVLISLVVAGVMYFLAPINAEMKKDAKDRVAGAISGLLIILLTYLIISTINPQLSFFYIKELTPTTVEPWDIKQEPGVYFCDKFPCDTTIVKPNTSSVLDFGILKKKITWVNIIQDTDNSNAYITVLYENPNLWGKCQYFNGSDTDTSGGMTKVDPFASSASVYSYDPNVNGDGVYFFRKPCFNDGKHNTIESLVNFCKDKEHGGFYKVPNSDIKNPQEIYTTKLDDLTFEEVPEEEQDCTKWDKKNLCTSRGPVSLGGENISSIIVNGNYLVLLVYFAPEDEDKGPWTACQEFPTTDDANKTGPRQVKWDIIRNSKGVVPNYVLIIPVKKSSPPVPTLTPLPIPAL